MAHRLATTPKVEAEFRIDFKYGRNELRRLPKRDVHLTDLRQDSKRLFAQALAAYGNRSQADS